ncbi:hypothetical protein OG455_41350 [Kitasatospora sp. NBC_01287]|uniref:hypothetical protein n=1 Tax=Kitasatospora sp. NBC_01287 TaxID=2903573 RepID=UPI0022511C0D|nr:hypothetical protein [Kitasatospora sp. NBC_01287]MCX4750930.1 hypothetical protein [Kitasatospora sp. NBC_01287]MCX4751819.1 hypothetical protein [Kitasatospora sp. NBC_01287]MCX4751889.1 hypothetical protein [Kitasatospora sp. NBC_01287]
MGPHRDRPIYVVTASHPDGSPYHDYLCTKITGGPYPCTGCGRSAYGDNDRDQKLANIRANGLTPHWRVAPEN